MKNLFFAALLTAGLFARPALAQDVVFLGEIHDNPHHHAVQAARVADLVPTAIVFEMLTADQAALITPALRADPVALAKALNWQDSGWPDFAMYYPIFTASDARIYGAAVPREAAHRTMSEGLETAFGADSARFGLDQALPQPEQSAREALQAEAHCNALPENMLAPMVDIQRLRDAVLARTVIEALDETGGPVAVITGNGHARLDWGAPAILAHAAPEIEMHVLGQTEEDASLQGVFDEVLSSPRHDRPDPCLAFQ